MTLAARSRWAGGVTRQTDDGKTDAFLFSFLKYLHGSDLLAVGPMLNLAWDDDYRLTVIIPMIISETMAGMFEVGQRISFEPPDSDPVAQSWYIYGLIDPADTNNTIRYIGVTPYPRKRLLAHVRGYASGTGPRFHEWIQELASVNRWPCMVILGITKGGRVNAIQVEWQHLRAADKTNLLNGFAARTRKSDR